MKRFLLVALVGVFALGMTSAVYANICAVDVVPAATILFPFVAYDYDGGFDGQTTMFSVTNVSSDAQIVHFTVWTDYSVAILDFNVVLTGYDVVRMNIRDILGMGYLPYDDADGGYQNIWAGQNEGDVLEYGPVSAFNELATWALAPLADPDPTAQGTAAAPLEPLACDPATHPASPNWYDDPIPVSTLNLFEGYLRASQTALKDYTSCVGVPITIENAAGNETWFIEREDGPVWMYITADVVASCNKSLPDSDASYFQGELLNTNVLVGDVVWMDNENRFAEADNAVHIEADAGYAFEPVTASTMQTLAPVGMNTFYNRYSGTDDDYREPLPTAWGFRYQYMPDAGINTWIRAWKGSMVTPTVFDLTEDSVAGVAVYDGTMSEGPDDLFANSCWSYTYYAWDEDENTNSVTPGQEPPWSGGETPDDVPVPNLLPLETQEVSVDQFFIVADANGDAFGWMMFIWPMSNTTDLDQMQTWMGTKLTGFGDYTAGLSGAVLGNYNCDMTQVLPGLGIGMYSE